MSKSHLSTALALTAFAVGALASVPAAGAAPAMCEAGKPGVLVQVDGLKQARGQLKLSLYGPDGTHWLAKGGKIAKAKVPVTARTMEVCLPVPSPGRYAVAVHHDLNLNGSRDRHDGGGFSRNPKVTLLRPKPAFNQASFAVGQGTARVAVTLLYIRGLRVAPAAV
jgi:uncharacterized protein (DUF2141 family)